VNFGVGGAEDHEDYVSGGREPGEHGGTRTEVDRFGPFRFDHATGELWRGPDRVPLQPQPARVLAALIQRPDALVSRRELADLLWGGRFAETDLGLNYCIRQIRRALDDDADSPRYVETVRGRGYRFRPPAAPVAAGAAPVGSRRRAWLVATAAVCAAIGLRGAGHRSLPDRPDGVPVLVTVAPFSNLTSVPSCSRVTGLVEAALEHELADAEPGAVRLAAPPFRTAGLVGYLVAGVVRGDAETRWVTVYLIRARDGRVTWNGSVRTSLLAEPSARAAFVRRMIGAIPTS
jgi:DNA-binding winged helix-turn-helix (wHTH) protein